jgi:phosphoribosylformylglycinamidine synthase
MHGLKTGTPPRMDLQKEKRLHDAVRSFIVAGLVRSAHDCSEGGFAVALAECCISHQAARGTPKLLGANVDLSAISGSRLDALLFGETQSRVILSTTRDNAPRIIEEAARLEVPARQIGGVGGSSLCITTSRGACTWALAELYDTWWNAIARAMEI